jgi:hypothetical protein
MFIIDWFKPKRTVFLIRRDGSFRLLPVIHMSNAGYVAHCNTEHIILLGNGRLNGSLIGPSGNKQTYQGWIMASGWTGDEVLLDSISYGDAIPMAKGGVVTEGCGGKV